MTLVVSKGPVLVDLPTSSGSSSTRPHRARGAGFKVDRAPALGGFFGTVRLQDPAGGSKAPKGSTVTLTIV